MRAQTNIHLSPRFPTSFERLQRKIRIQFALQLASLLPTSGQRSYRKWLDERMNSGKHNPGCFFAPLPFVEAALGSLPRRSCRVHGINTIMANWIDCHGKMINGLDYFLGTGTWSGLISSTDGDPVREEAQQILDAYLNYKRTEVYEVLLHATLNDPPQRRQARQLKTATDVDNYFERFVRLFRSILQNGVIPHHEVDKFGVHFNRDRGMGLAIDLDGSLHRLQGANHRWAIAQVLDLPTVPVEIRLIHIGSGMGLEERLDRISL